MDEFIVGPDPDDANASPQPSYFKNRRHYKSRWQIPAYMPFVLSIAVLVLGWLSVNAVNWSFTEMDVVLNYPAVYGLSLFSVLMAACVGTIIYVLVSIWISFRNRGGDAKWVIVLRHIPGVLIVLMMTIGLAAFNHRLFDKVGGSISCDEGRCLSGDQWKWVVGRHGEKLKSKSSAIMMQVMRRSLRDELPDSDTIEALVQTGADVHMKDEFGNTPLLLVSFVNKRYLTFLTTPVHSEYMEKFVNDHCQNVRRITKMLLACGADVNLANQNGNTPLYYLAWWGTPEMVADYLSAGADPLAKNDAGQTPLSVANYVVASLSPETPNAICWQFSPDGRETLIYWQYLIGFQKQAQLPRAKAVLELLQKAAEKQSAQSQPSAIGDGK